MAARLCDVCGIRPAVVRVRRVVVGAEEGRLTFEVLEGAAAVAGEAE